MTREDEPASDRKVLSGETLVDFRHLTPDQLLATVAGIDAATVVIVPESLAAAYATIPTEAVVATVFVPDDASVRAHTGTVLVGGDGVGAVEDILIVTGMLIITSPITGPLPHRIHVVGSLIAPRGSESALGLALAGVTGEVRYYPYVEGQDFRTFTGQVRLSGALLSNPAGQPDDILLAAGQVIMTGEFSTVGFRQLIVTGQVVAPMAARDVIEPWLRMQGQLAWYRSDDPRILFDDTVLTPDFFRVLDHPVSLIVFGDLTITDGVTEEMIMAKIADLFLFGDAVVPAGLLGATQAVTTDAFGAIRASDASNASNASSAADSSDSGNDGPGV